MTKSAKQDTKEGPAKTAEAESAATTDADATESADATPAAATEQQGTEHSGDSATDEAGKPDIDDVKAKFREALDRKHQAHAEGQGKGSHETGKVSGAHGPAASRRNFRRKSG
jgi:hypothetical protein